MIPLIEQKKELVALACREFSVARLYVFGSATSDVFDENRSDLDFLVTFAPEARTRAFDRYFDLKERLETIFNRPIDLLTEPSIRNSTLRSEIERSRQPIYGP